MSQLTRRGFINLALVASFLGAGTDTLAAVDPTKEYLIQIISAARRRGCDPWLLWAIIKAESNGNPRAISPKDARGIAQLMIYTARRYRPDMHLTRHDLHDPILSLDIAADHLADLQGLVRSHFPGASLKSQVKLVASSYNAGWLRVKNVRGIPRIAETQGYAISVWNNYVSYKKHYPWVRRVFSHGTNN